MRAWARRRGAGRLPLGRTLPFLGLVLGCAALFVIRVAVEVVRVSRDPAERSGLEYDAFLRTLDDLLSAPEPLVDVRSTVVGLAPGRTIRLDTLVVVGDTLRLPSLARGAFLHEQVLSFNRFERERLALGREEPELFDLLEPHNPSVFRVVRTTEGDLKLARATRVWRLQVPSPHEEAWAGEIVSRDLVRSSGLMGPRSLVPLREPVQLVREVDGRRQRCEFMPVESGTEAYCLSDERLPQATFRTAGNGGAARGTAVAGWADLWVDGRRIAPGDSIPIRGGSILRLDPLEPLVFAEYWEGVLSTRQWVNGRLRRRADTPIPLDLFSDLGLGPSRSTDGESRGASVELGLHSGASLELSHRLDRFLSRQVSLPVEFAAAVLIRVPDGQVVAVAEAGHRSVRGRSRLLDRVVPGSAVKPLLAAAVLSQRPQLGTVEIPARDGPVRSVLGLPPVAPRRAFQTALNCGPPPDDRVDLREFLRCSNNEYAASLVLAGILTGERGEGLEGTRVRREVLLRSPLARGLEDLYGLAVDPVITGAAGRDARLWEGLVGSDGRAFPVPIEVVPERSRPALLASGTSEGTDLALLYRYAFGAWENAWTLFDLAGGFGRVVADRRIDPRFQASGPAVGELDGAEGPPPRLGLAGQAWYGDFLSGLRAVADDGTARGLRRAWRRAGLPGGVHAKTGTLAEDGEVGGLFVKSLLFAIGPDEGERSPMRCGLAGAVYMRFRQGPSRGGLPSYQLRFAEEEMGAFLADHWEELGACSG